MNTRETTQLSIVSVGLLLLAIRIWQHNDLAPLGSEDRDSLIRSLRASFLQTRSPSLSRCTMIDLIPSFASR